MNSWRRIRSIVKAAKSAISSEPLELAPLIPIVDDAITLLEKPPSNESIEEIIYLLTQIQKFVERWRPSPKPSPGIFYMQPGWARSTDEQTGEALSLLNEFEISDFIEEKLTFEESNIKMNVFISHSSADSNEADALVDLIRSALNLSAKDIRCTSVPGYKLPAGADSNKQLRSEVFECEIFIALLSPSSMKSVYVMFELGARWGSNKFMAPIMIKGIKARDLKAPLSAIHSINGSSEEDIHQLIDDLSERLKVPSEKPAIYSKTLRSFINICDTDTV